MNKAFDVQASLNNGELLFSKVHQRFYIKHQLENGLQGCLELEPLSNDLLLEKLDMTLFVTSKEYYLACAGTVKDGAIVKGVCSNKWVVARQVNSTELEQRA
jgi:hypothetical protein